MLAKGYNEINDDDTVDRYYFSEMMSRLARMCPNETPQILEDVNQLLTREGRGRLIASLPGMMRENPRISSDFATNALTFSESLEPNSESLRIAINNKEMQFIFDYYLTIEALQKTPKTALSGEKAKRVLDYMVGPEIFVFSQRSVVVPAL